MQQVVNIVKGEVALSANHSKGSMYSSIREFQILKAFDVKCHPPSTPKIIQVNWSCPPLTWVKCNTNGASRGFPGASACGGIFRDHGGSFLGGFSESLGISNAFQAEVKGVICAIEFAAVKGWTNFWLECDSSLTIQAF
ncbi:ribonuclease H, partial [Trifolium pratense]